MGQDDTTSFGTGCPLPPGWSPGTAVITCSRSQEPGVRTGSNARALVPDFRVLGGSAPLPTRCAPAFVTGRLRSALSAFNSGREIAFAGRFAPRAVFHPYGPTEKELWDGRRSPASQTLAMSRVRAGPGRRFALHTARIARAFGSARRKVASYRLGLLLSKPGEALVASDTSVVVDCSSGLVHRWAGPPVPG